MQPVITPEAITPSARRPGPGPDPQTGGSVHGTAGLPHLPQLWGRHWLWVHVSAHGVALGGLREEVQARICHFPSAPGLHRRDGALQLHPDHLHDPGTF